MLDEFRDRVARRHFATPIPATSTSPADDIGSEYIRRAIDIAVAVLALIFAAPLIAFYAVALRIISPGPIVMGFERLGLGEKPFKLLKLRTMWPDAEARFDEILENSPELRREWQLGFKLKDDPRLVPLIGRPARRLCIDELPQLINVIRGEMTLVGPRPFPRYHLDTFSADFRQRRASVPPGLTGVWQVERLGNNVAEQVALDEKHLANRSLPFDMGILLRTFKAILVGHGAN